jgi:hypothetical protein
MPQLHLRSACMCICICALFLAFEFTLQWAPSKHHCRRLASIPPTPPTLHFQPPSLLPSSRHPPPPPPPPPPHSIISGVCLSRPVLFAVSRFPQPDVPCCFYWPWADLDLDPVPPLLASPRRSAPGPAFWYITLHTYIIQTAVAASTRSTRRRVFFCLVLPVAGAPNNLNNPSLGGWPVVPSTCIECAHSCKPPTYQRKGGQKIWAPKQSSPSPSPNPTQHHASKLLRVSRLGRICMCVVHRT